MPGTKLDVLYTKTCYVVKAEGIFLMFQEDLNLGHQCQITLTNSGWQISKILGHKSFSFFFIPTSLFP